MKTKSKGPRFLAIGLCLGLISGSVFGNIPLGILLGLAFCAFLKYHINRR